MPRHRPEVPESLLGTVANGIDERGVGELFRAVGRIEERRAALGSRGIAAVALGAACGVDRGAAFQLGLWPVGATGDTKYGRHRGCHATHGESNARRRHDSSVHRYRRTVQRPTPLRTPAVAVFSVALALLAGACGSDAATTGDSRAPATAIGEADAPSTSTSAATTTSSSTSTSTTTSTSSSTTTSTSSTTTTTSTSTVAVQATVGLLDLSADRIELGVSAGGRPIVAEQSGTPGGRRVLVIGVIHGDEDAGMAIVDELRAEPVPDGVELWIVESMNPDGQTNQVRSNDNGVDLNRNFPYKWGPIGVPGDSQFAGTGPASEPETQAMVNFMTQLQPDITIWYHQDLFVVNPSQGRDGRIRERYAELTGLPMGEITGGTYTGIAATWARNEFRPDDGVAFIVELGPTLSPIEAITHADAVRTIATEG